MNAANSGVAQVPTITGTEQAQPLVAPEQIIQKDGYLYIYVSNESAQKVFFNNLVTHHNEGHLLEEDQYYPFGLKMAGISDEALPVVPNNYLYNGKEFNNDEFSDGSGLDWYSYGMREYDPQLGRFPQLDPLTDEFPTLTPYQYASNDPVANIDWDGLEGLNSIGGLAGASSKIAMWGDLSEVLVTAAKPITTSSVFFKGLDAIGRIGNYVSIASHGVQIIDHVFYGMGVTQAVGSQINSSEMKAIFPGANNDIVNGFVKNFNQYSGQFGITDDETMAQFLAQTGEETWKFTLLSEKMKYTKKNIHNLKINFGRLFGNGDYNALDYVNNASGLAKLAYGSNKYGIDFRGRGFMQLTEEGKYKNFTDFYDKNFNSSVDFVAHPDLIGSNYKYATISALWYFKTHVIDAGTNMINTEAVTFKITGRSYNGLSNRIKYFEKASEIIQLSSLSEVGLFGTF